MQCASIQLNKEDRNACIAYAYDNSSGSNDNDNDISAAKYVSLEY